LYRAQWDHIDPSLLSLVSAPVDISTPTLTPTLRVRRSSINFDSSIVFGCLNFGSDFHGNPVIPSIELPFRFPSQDFPFNFGLYNEAWVENILPFPEDFSDVPFASTAHPETQPPAMDTYSTPTTQAETLTSPPPSFDLHATSSPSSVTSTSQSSPASSSSVMTAGSISCTWPGCERSFPLRADYNHHFLNHSRPFKCPQCSARHATKRHLDRHINIHLRPDLRSEMYYCSVNGCGRSVGGVGQPFGRHDNFKRHLTGQHGFSDEEAQACVEAQKSEETRRRRERGMRRRS
jgi:hypothetical protein